MSPAVTTDVEKPSAYCKAFDYVDAAATVWLKSRHVVVANKVTACRSVNQ